MTVLPLTYLGSTEWFVHLLAGDCIIDVGENWVKQTVRNRCDILTANGVSALTIPVHGYGAKIAAKDVRIDNSKNWQHRHWLSIVSAYRNSPFFDHYEERFAPLYEKQYKYLTLFNLELFDILTEVLGLDIMPQISEKYVIASSYDVDVRGKKALRIYDNPTLRSPGMPEYTQVFSDRMGFVAGLSVIDLLFCESGRVARQMLLRRSYPR